MLFFGRHILFIVLCWCSVIHASSAVPRVVVGLFNSHAQPDVKDTAIHQFAEMPLNYLGYAVWYHDILEGLPDLRNRNDVIGVLTYFKEDTSIPDADAYLSWAEEVMKQGKRYIVMGLMGFNVEQQQIPLERVNKFWKQLGLYHQGDYIPDAYDYTIKINTPHLVDFEWPYQGVLAGFPNLKTISQDITAHVLMVNRHSVDDQAVVIATGTKGGYAADQYSIRWDPVNDTYRHWYIDPFMFFHLALGDADIPKPDSTTLVGRRVFYSHIDGDGWNSRSKIEEFRTDRALCAEVLFKRALEAHPDIPCTVGAIAADMDDSWVGFPEARKWAREIFKLPHVEVAAHTFSHPFDWVFFEHYSPAAEEPYLHLYPNGTWVQEGILTQLRRFWGIVIDEAIPEPSSKRIDHNIEGYQDLAEGYVIPRAYAKEPFNLHLEVEGALAVVNELAPSGKKAHLYSWSGDCNPFPAAVKLTREAGVRNLNGGNTRYDTEFPSYSWVRPLGRQAGDQQQILASMSNENIYTDNWLHRFYDFNKLPQTIHNTNTPWRIKPINLYYHMFSGERLASLNAVLSNIDSIKLLEMTPVTASHYAALADGFYSTQILSTEEGGWAIETRGSLQTIRFDNSTLRAVDFSKSHGVIGQRHYQGSLYVALEPNEQRPIITLKRCVDCWEEPAETKPYLISSRWPIWEVKGEGAAEVSFKTMGFGSGDMEWKVVEDGTYTLSSTYSNGEIKTVTVASMNKQLRWMVANETTLTPLLVHMKRAP